MTRENKQGALICTGLFLFFAVMGGFALYHSASADSLDHETLCRTNKKDPVVKLLIDKTDPWGQHGQQRLTALIHGIKNRLAQHERLSIFIMDETGTYSPSPLFDMCNPGRGDQANVLNQTPRREQKKFEEQFATPLDALLSTLLLPGTAPRSPLIETVKELRGNNAQERLIMVSDMMQNSAELTFYGQNQAGIGDGHEEICSMVNPYQTVEVYYINRPGISVTRKQRSRNFWNNCLGQVAWETKWNTL